MDSAVRVEQVMVGSEKAAATIQSLKEELAVSERTADVVNTQKLRCCIRFLTRFIQYRTRKIGDMDFLAALRDYVLFVGQVSVPPDLRMIVQQQGSAFALHLLNNQIVDAELYRSDWLNNDAFLRQVYGKECVQSSHKTTSCGDKLLKDATGFASYRSFEQKIAVHTALSLPDGYTLQLSLPTGAGKSLLTQMLAACVDGLTVVIVPTVALALDQHRAAKAVFSASLEEKQIAYYTSGLGEQKVSSIMDGICDSSLRLLITSPEAIVKNPRLKAVLMTAAKNKTLKHLVIDEAHIVQDWGTLFRPDFQMMSIIRRDFLAGTQGQLKTVLLSATMTEVTVSSLKTLFSEDDNWVELRCDALRPEPRYCTQRFNRKEVYTKKILQFCRILPKPMILYEIKPDDANHWKRLLREEGFSNVVTFTGETDDNERDHIIKLWSEDKIDIVLATSAFGLGIDKPDVRTVLHATLPENINRYYQEVGRGGRDGLPSLSVLCYNTYDDASMVRYITNSRVLTVFNMLDRWFSMLENETTERDGDAVLLDTSTPPTLFTEEQRERRGSQNIRWNLSLLMFLVRYGYLDFLEMAFVPIQNCYHVRVSMRDVVLMQDRDRLQAALEPDRENEMQIATNGYEVMKGLAQNREQSCRARYFTELFPQAAETCGGCPTHRDAYSYDEPCTLHNRVALYIDPNPVDERLDILMSSLNNMLIRREENEIWSVTKALQLAFAVNTLGINVLVLPETPASGAEVFSGLVVDAEEFQVLAGKQPSLFSGGVLCAFDNDIRHNQLLFRWAQALEEMGIRVLYYCKETMWITSQARPIRHLLNGNTVAFEEILGV